MFLKLYIFVLLIHFHIYESTSAHAQFTNLKCLSYNSQYVAVSTCRMRAIERRLSEVNVRIRLHQPVDNITVHVEFLKKSNGYKRYYLPELTIDVCKFLINKKANPLHRYLYKFVEPCTNMNHTCPYDHDIVLEGLRVDESLTANAPVPNGEYAFYTTWKSNNV